MTRQDWKAFAEHQRKSLGFKGASELFPYILSGADPERGAQAVAQPRPRFD